VPSSTENLKRLFIKKIYGTYVREIALRDIDLIADYWLKSDPDFTVGMGVDLNKLPTRKKLR